MHIKAFMIPHDKVITCRPDHSVRTALDLMVTKKVGSVIVMDPDKVQRPVGIVTSTDMLKAFHKKVDIDDTDVSELMQIGLTGVLDTMNRDDAAKVLERETKHHAIVIDKVGNWKGLISSYDITTECAKDARAWPWTRNDAGKFSETDVSPGSPRGPIEAQKEKRSSFVQYIDNLEYLDM